MAIPDVLAHQLHENKQAIREKRLDIPKDADSYYEKFQTHASQNGQFKVAFQELFDKYRGEYPGLPAEKYEHAAQVFTEHLLSSEFQSLVPGFSFPIGEEVLGFAATIHVVYRVDTCLGFGSDGAVYLAMAEPEDQQHPKSLLALKISQEIVTHNDVQDTVRLIDPVEEMKLIHRLQKQNNGMFEDHFVKVHEVFWTEKGPFQTQLNHQATQPEKFWITVMEYLSLDQWTDLDKELKNPHRNRDRDIEGEKSIASELARIYDFLAEENCIDYDSSPKNIMVSRDGHIKLIDLGMLVDRSQNSDPPGFAGQIQYSPPEKMNGKIRDVHKYYVFVYASILYEMFTGQPLNTSDKIEAFDTSIFFENEKKEELLRQLYQGLKDRVVGNGVLPADPEKYRGILDIFASAAAREEDRAFSSCLQLFENIKQELSRIAEPLPDTDHSPIENTDSQMQQPPLELSRRKSRIPEAARSIVLSLIGKLKGM